MSRKVLSTNLQPKGACVHLIDGENLGRALRARVRRGNRVKLAVLAVAASVASTGLLAGSAFAARPAQKVVPISCGAIPKHASFSPTQQPAVIYRAVAPLGFGAVSGDLYFGFAKDRQLVRTAERPYNGQPAAVYRFAPLPPGHYTVTIRLQTPRRSDFRTCSAVTHLVVAPRPAPLISPLPEPSPWRHHRR